MIPLLIGGAATGGSILANMFADGNRSKARKKALGAEDKRQDALDAEIGALNTGSQNRYLDFETGRQARGNSIADYFRTLVDADPGASATPVSNSQPTLQAIASQRAAQQAASGARTTAQGNLMSFGDYLASIGRSQARDASRIGQLGGFKLGSSRVLPLELEAANQEGGPAGLLGDVLQLIGSTAIRSGLSGGMVA